MLKQPQKARNTSEGTIIGAGVKMTGSLRDEGPITINGQARGDIYSEQSIFIGENAYVEGPISAKIIVVAGIVEGEIKAEESLEITPTGKVSGKIDTKTLVVKPGALFIGQCKMSEAVEEIKQTHKTSSQSEEMFVPETEDEEEEIKVKK